MLNLICFTRSEMNEGGGKKNVGMNGKLLYYLSEYKVYYVVALVIGLGYTKSKCALDPNS